MEAPDRTEIDRLKAQKKAQREAREAAGGPAVHEVPAAAPAAIVAEVPEAGALALLASAEALAALMRNNIAAANAALAAYKAAPDAAAGTALQHSVTVITGQVGSLQSKIDEVSIGDLDEDARDAARARRKTLNASVEGELMPAVALLRKATSPAALAA